MSRLFSDPPRSDIEMLILNRSKAAEFPRYLSLRCYVLHINVLPLAFLTLFAQRRVVTQCPSRHLGRAKIRLDQWGHERLPRTAEKAGVPTLIILLFITSQMKKYMYYYT